MKKENKIVTEIEYQEILNRLDAIEEERGLLKSFDFQEIYNNHVEMFNSFDEVIIALKRKKFFIEYEIELERRRYLSNLILTDELKLRLETEIKQLIFQCLLTDNSLDNDNLDTVFIPILMNYPDFRDFLDKILDLTSKQVSNLYLLEYVMALQIEQEKLLSKKSKYEKHQKKTLKKVRKI
ncbi:MAG: hypothetical protein IJ509_03600 [Bacilli bacterium]|nr:hypothetical protein [Bacilli bacterium]